MSLNRGRQLRRGNKSMGNHHKPPQYNLQDMWVTFHACEKHSSYPNFFLSFSFCFSPLFFCCYSPLALGSAGRCWVTVKILFILHTSMNNFGHTAFSDREGTRVRRGGRKNGRMTRERKKKRKSGLGLQIAYYFFFLIIYAILSIYV